MEKMMDSKDEEHLETLREKSQETHATLMADPEEAETEATYGEVLAEKITSAIATWKFIIVQTSLILLWTGYNIVIRKAAFDPYPFILLNLFLSFQSAYTAPAIMMNQKRQAKNDQIRNEMESDINVKADLEITALHDKVDNITKNEIADLKQKIEHLTSLLENSAAQRT